MIHVVVHVKAGLNDLRHAGTGPKVRRESRRRCALEQDAFHLALGLGIQNRWTNQSRFGFQRCRAFVPLRSIPPSHAAPLGAGPLRDFRRRIALPQQINRANPTTFQSLDFRTASWVASGIENGTLFMQVSIVARSLRSRQSLLSTACGISHDSCHRQRGRDGPEQARTQHQRRESREQLGGQGRPLGQQTHRHASRVETVDFRRGLEPLCNQLALYLQLPAQPVALLSQG